MSSTPISSSLISSSLNDLPSTPKIIETISERANVFKMVPTDNNVVVQVSSSSISPDSYNKSWLIKTLVSGQLTPSQSKVVTFAKYFLLVLAVAPNAVQLISQLVGYDIPFMSVAASIVALAGGFSGKIIDGIVKLMKLYNMKSLKDISDKIGIEVIDNNIVQFLSDHKGVIENLTDDNCITLNAGGIVFTSALQKLCSNVKIALIAYGPFIDKKNTSAKKSIAELEKCINNILSGNFTKGHVVSFIALSHQFMLQITIASNSDEYVAVTPVNMV
jgi:hypothetical protein